MLENAVVNKTRHNDTQIENKAHYDERVREHSQVSGTPILSHSQQGSMNRTVLS